MNPLDALRMEFGRRRDRPGRAPDQFNRHDAEVWRAGYVWAMNEAANLTARQKWDLDESSVPLPGLIDALRYWGKADWYIDEVVARARGEISSYTGKDAVVRRVT